MDCNGICWLMPLQYGTYLIEWRRLRIRGTCPWVEHSLIMFFSTEDKTKMMKNQ